MISITVGGFLITVAEELEVVDSGGSLTTAEQASMIARLQRLIDSSNVQKPLIFAERRDPLTLTALQQSYTIGIDPAGLSVANFNAPRPTKIDRANLLIAAGVRRPIGIWDEKRWAGIRNQTVYGPPRGLYLDRGFTSGFANLFFFPTPDQAYQFELYSWAQNANITSTMDTLDYPPAYADYWLYGMVIRCASMFGRQPTETHIELYKEAKEALLAANCPSPEMAAEPALVSDEAGYYDWRGGEVVIL